MNFLLLGFLAPGKRQLKHSEKSILFKVKISEVRLGMFTGWLNKWKYVCFPT